MIKQKKTHNYLAPLGLLVLQAVLWTSCTAKVGGISPEEFSDTATITLVKFQSLALADIPVGTHSEYKTGNKTFTFEGTCPKGAATVRVKFNAVDAGIGAPCVNESFLWSKDNAITPNQIVTAEFYLANIAGAPIEGPTLSKKFYVDAVPPTAPTVLTINGTQVNAGGIYPISTLDGSASVVGNVSSNDAAIYVSTDSQGTFSTQSNAGFTFDTVLTNGETRVVIISISDDLGNSSTVQFTLTYGASVLSTAPHMIQTPAAAQAIASLTSGSYKLVRATIDQNGSLSKTSGSYSMQVGTTNLLKQVQ